MLTMTGADPEAPRVAALHAHADPDGSQSPDLDDLVVRAAEIAGVPMATLNLLDHDRQCSVVTSGCAAAVTPRCEAMCNVTLELGTFVHVPDAAADPRFTTSPWVDGRLGNVRFYASAPLVTRQGQVIGTLCAFDIEPHELSAAQVAELSRLAAQAIAIFERRSG